MFSKMNSEVLKLYLNFISDITDIYNHKNIFGMSSFRKIKKRIFKFNEDYSFYLKCGLISDKEDLFLQDNLKIQLNHLLKEEVF